MLFKWLYKKDFLLIDLCLKNKFFALFKKFETFLNKYSCDFLIHLFEIFKLLKFWLLNKKFFLINRDFDETLKSFLKWPVNLELFLTLITFWNFDLTLNFLNLKKFVGQDRIEDVFNKFTFNWFKKKVVLPLLTFDKFFW